MSKPKKDPGALDVDTPLSAQVSYLEQLVRGSLTDAQFEYWSNVWKAAVTAAAKKMSDNRRSFYSYQGISSAAAVIILALAGLNLSGIGGIAVRWINFVVGLIGALAAAALQLFRFGPRWRMNRHTMRILLESDGPLEWTWQQLKPAIRTVSVFHPDSAWSGLSVTR